MRHFKEKYLGNDTQNGWNVAKQKELQPRDSDLGITNDTQRGAPIPGNYYACLNI